MTIKGDLDRLAHKAWIDGDRYWWAKGNTEE